MPTFALDKPWPQQREYGEDIDDGEHEYFIDRLEEALDGSKKTATGKIRDSLNMLDDMRRDFENMAVK